jgi:hypothetical protein
MIILKKDAVAPESINMKVTIMKVMCVIMTLMIMRVMSAATISEKIKH